MECSLKIFTYVRVCAYKVLLLRYVYGDVVLYKYLYAHTQVQAAICHEIAGGLNPLPRRFLYILLCWMNMIGDGAAHCRQTLTSLITQMKFLT